MRWFTSDPRLQHPQPNDFRKQLQSGGSSTSGGWLRRWCFGNQNRAGTFQDILTAGGSFGSNGIPARSVVRSVTHWRDGSVERKLGRIHSPTIVNTARGRQNPLVGSKPVLDRRRSMTTALITARDASIVPPS